VQGALLGYDPDPPASPPRPLGPDVNYTFGHGLQGWEFNLFNGGSITNIAAAIPPGGSPPTLTINPTDGAPEPGSLQVGVHFTALDQYVDPNVNFFNGRLNLTGKTLHARIRLVSGSFGGGVQFHASSGDSFVFTGAFFGPDQFPPGVWVPVTLDLTSGTVAGFDPTQVVQLGVQFFSGFSGGGATFVDSGPTIFEIDTVTD